MQEKHTTQPQYQALLNSGAISGQCFISRKAWPKNIRKLHKDKSKVGFTKDISARTQFAPPITSPVSHHPIAGKSRTRLVCIPSAKRGPGHRAHLIEALFKRIAHQYATPLYKLFPRIINLIRCNQPCCFTGISTTLNSSNSFCSSPQILSRSSICNNCSLIN